MVDDGSTDLTAEVSEKEGAYVVRHKTNKGYDHALLSGFRKAEELKMETIIKVILKLGTCEIIYFKDLSHKISIAEYNKLSSSFLNKNEVGLINGILDQVAKNITNE